MAAKKGTKKRRADSSESAQRDESTASESTGTKSTKGRSGTSRPAVSKRTGQPLEGKVEAIRDFASRVNWGRVALLTVGVAATVVAVRAVGPRRIVKGVSSLGIAHLAEKNAHKISALVSGLFARIWPTITKTASTVVKPPQALLSRLH